MSRFVRQSSYRHVFGTPAKKEKVYDNIKISASAWDTNLVSASEKYIAVNYQSSGGGAFLVTPLDQTGKLPDLFPLCRAHTAPVLDTAWSPFNDSLVASAGEDGRVAVTYIDETILSQAFNNETSEVRDFEPVSKFAAHGRKAGHVVWHPTAEGILASASTEVKIWDVGAEKNVYTGETHSDMVQSLTWDYCGTTYATTCKDKKLRLFDPRAGSAAVVVADSHSGIKGSRVAWMGSLDRIVTTGFSKSSERQVYVWDSRDLMKGPIKSLSIDQSSGTLMPFWNQGNNILFLAGKGDGNIRYYEYENDDLFYLTEYTSHSPQRGMCFLPPRALNANDNEIARAFKCVGTTVEPISFVVPRKSDSFQSDLFPPAASSTAPLTAEKWLSGSNATPILLDMETRQTAAADSTPTPAPYVRSTPAVTATPRAAVATVSTPAPAPAHTPVAVSTPTPTPTASAPAPTPQAPITNRVLEAPKIDTPAASTPSISAAQSQQTNGSSNDAEVESLKELVERLKKDNESLKEEVAERDTLIRGLELKLEKVKSAFS